MAVFNSAPSSGRHPLSIETLRRKMGVGGPLFEYMKHFASRDVVRHFDDFLGDTINLDDYAVATGGGAASAVWAINVQEDGWIRATTGTAGDATTTMSLIGPAIYYGDRNPGMEVRFKPITAVTEVKIEMGFVDVVPSSNATVVNSVTTPTVNASVVDAAVYHFRNASSVITNTFATIGTTISAAKTAFTPPTAVAANTKYRIRIQLIGNTAYLLMDDVLVASHKTAGTDYVEGGNPLAPWIAVQASNGTSKSLDVDYIDRWKDRN